MKIEARETENVIIFEIRGRICRSYDSAASLHHLVKAHLDQGHKNILLSLENAELIDSFGISEILASYISTQNIGGKIKLTRIPQKLGVIFCILGLDRVLEIFDNEASALQSFNKP